MHISDLGQASGVDIETIRFYEKSGLLPSPSRYPNGYRIYGPVHLERLAFIRHCRVLDMPLAEVKRLLDFIAHPEADCGDINRLIDEQLVRVRTKLMSLQALKRQLTALRGHCDAGHTARDCGILQELVEFARGAAATDHATPKASRKKARTS